MKLALIRLSKPDNKVAWVNPHAIISITAAPAFLDTDEVALVNLIDGTTYWTTDSVDTIVERIAEVADLERGRDDSSPRLAQYLSPAEAMARTDTESAR